MLLTALRDLCMWFHPTSFSRLVRQEKQILDIPACLKLTDAQKQQNPSQKTR